MSKDYKPSEDPEALQPVPSMVGTVKEDPSQAHDAVFGTITNEGPNYRNVGWVGTSVLMMKTQIGLGVLTIPSTFDILGIVPGVVLLCAVSAITTWSNYIVGVFKKNHPEVYSLDDAGFAVMGKIGKEVLAAAFLLYWIFVSGSGMLGVSIGLNSVSTHGACTAVFVAVAAVMCFLLASIRTLGKITWLAWVGMLFIMSSILVVTVAVGVQERPAAAPQEGHWTSDFKVARNPGFAKGMSAISSLVFAYSGTPGFFSIAAEMRDPRMYTRSLMICQAVVTATYIAIGVVVYYYCGSYVASPALGSAGVLMKKICYGLALPGLLVTMTIVTHIPSKYLFIRILRGSEHLTANTITHWAAWLGCTSCITIIAYIIASAIPVFDGLVSLIGALLCPLICLIPMAGMWLHDNYRRPERGITWYFMVPYCIFLIVAGVFLMAGGTYGSAVGIAESYKASGGSAAWACADNSNSV